MKRFVLVSYAINGRGLGHLTRQLAILRWVRRYCGVIGAKAECWILTSSEGDTLARREGIPALKIPSKAMMRDADIDPARYLAIARTWVLSAIAGLQPDLLVVGTFPGGSFGELVSTLELAKKRALVARRVRYEIAGEDAYRTLLPLYDLSISPDDGGTGPIMIRERDELLPREAARQALGIPEGQRAVWVTLGGGGDPAAASTLPRLVDRLRGRGWHVVVAAGPLYQGPEKRGEGITWLDRYSTMELLLGVDAAVSAGGYNAFHELMYAGIPTVFLPQPRIADDQAARVDLAVSAGAGRRAPTLESVPDLLEAPGSGEAARRLVPENGARKAAAQLLALVLPAEDVAAAEAAWRPELLRSPAGRALAPARLLEIVRLFAGDPPSVWAARRGAAAELRERGVAVGAVPTPSGSAPERFLELVDAHGTPPDVAVQLAQQIARKFPAARPSEVLSACEALWPLWARFDDWMGALSLMRAVPTQRQYLLPAFVDALAGWLSREPDLFDAVRAFSRLEGGGALPVAEVLAVLAQREPGPGGLSVVG